MSKTDMIKVLILAMAVIAMTGCASTSDQTVAEQPEEPSAVFEKPIAQVQQAAVDALAVIGCDIKKQEPTFVEGRRPHKVGAFVGSGGETVRVWLESLDPQKTSVKVETDKSLMGVVGQKNWDKQVLDEMTKELSQ